MKKSNMKKSKVVAVALAGTLAVSAMLAGTYAWQSISQLALNEANEEVNPGARLHDDFNGIASYSLTAGEDAKVKNVYVENFTDAAKGGQPVYARIRLEEYLEIGSGAGKAQNNQATSVDSNATLGDLSSWTIYQWDGAPTFRDYVEIGTGGSTIYMPTYNRNRDSLEADINGTMAGENGTAYDDYVKYAANDKKVGVEIYDADDDETDEAAAAKMTTDQLIEAVIYTKDEGGKKAGDLKITTGSTDITVTTENGAVTCPINVETDPSDPGKITAITVDLDMNTEAGDDIRMEFVDSANTHKAKATKTASVISMQDWMNGGSLLGNYWVCDTDGWAYWASPINPGETTGCLINSITLKPSANITGEYYYGLNVRAQFATAGDWGNGVFTAASTSGPGGGSTGFYADGITENAMRLLEKAAGAVKTVEVTTNDPVNEGMKGGETATFKAEVSLGSVPVTDEVVTWSLEGKTSADTTIARQPDGSAILTIGEDETAYSVTVVATSKKTGENTKTVGIYIVPIKDSYVIEISAPENTTTVGQNTRTTFTALVSKRGKVDKSLDVTWSVESNDRNHSDLNVRTVITSSSGILSVADAEEAESLKVIATCNDDPSVKAEYEVDVVTKYEMIKNMPVGTTQTVTIDGIEWYVLERNDSDTEALLWAASSIKDSEGAGIKKSFGTSNVWNNSDSSRESEMYIYLNDESTGFLSTLTELNDSRKILEKEIYTRKSSSSGNQDSDFYKSTSKIFLLSEADLFGTFNSKTDGLKSKDYTNGKSQLITTGEMRQMIGWGWLRSPVGSNVATIGANGTRGDASAANINGYIRPALWISLD